MKDWRIHHALSRWPRFFGLNEADQADLVRRIQSLIAEDRQEAPPQRQPLRDEEIDELVLQVQFLLICDGLEELKEIARAVERAHGIGETK